MPPWASMYSTHAHLAEVGRMLALPLVCLSPFSISFQVAVNLFYACKWKPIHRGVLFCHKWCDAKCNRVDSRQLNRESNQFVDVFFVLIRKANHHVHFEGSILVQSGLLCTGHQMLFQRSL